MSKKPGDYRIGFGRPPTHTQFKKGRSGNPKGRPKGSKNLETLFFEVLMKPTKLQEGNRTKTVPRIVGIFEVLLGKAAAGDVKLFLEFLKLALQLNALALLEEKSPKAPADEMPVREKFTLMLSQIEGRLRGDPIAGRPLPGQEVFRP